MSDANRTKVSMVEEVTPGTTPATPVFENLRVTGANLAYAKSTDVSKELRSDRQVTDVITLGFQAGGDIPQEVSYGAMDSEFRGGLQSEWVPAQIRQNIAGTTNITAVSATAYTVLATAGTQYNSGVFVPLMLVRASGFTNAGNNRDFVAAAGTTGTSVAMTGGTVEASPPVGARLKQIGFQAASGDIVAVAGGIPTQGLTSTVINFTTLGLDVGEWVYVGGPTAGTSFATAATKGFARISSITATALLFDVVPTGWAADAGAGKTINVYVGDYIRNGVTKRSYTVELQYQDIAVPEYEYYTGMVIGQIDFTVQAQAILSARTTMMGLNAVNQTTRFASSTDQIAPTNDVMNSSANVGFIYENGTAVVGPNFVLGASFTINNNVRRNNAVGSPGSVLIGLGRFRVSGSLNMYYGNNAVLQRIRQSTASGYQLCVLDPAANTKALLFDMPKIKFTDGNPTVPGVDTDRMLDGKFEALMHGTLLYTMHIQRFEAFNV